MKNYIPWEEPPAGAGKQHEEEGAAERKHYRLIAIPVPQCYSRREKVEESGIWEEGVWGGGGVSSVFISHYPTVINWQ